MTAVVCLCTVYCGKNCCYHDVKRKTTKENMYCDKNHCYCSDRETKEIEIKVLVFK